MLRHLLQPLAMTYISSHPEVFYKKCFYATLKSDPDLPKKFVLLSLIENPLKMMKNAFYFNLKAIFVLKMFEFLSRLFGHVGKTVCLERSG